MSWIYFSLLKHSYLLANGSCTDICALLFLLWLHSLIFSLRRCLIHNEWKANITSRPAHACLHQIKNTQKYHVYQIFILSQQMVIISPSFTHHYVIQIHIVFFFSCETLKLLLSVNLVSFIYYDSFCWYFEINDILFSVFIFIWVKLLVILLYCLSF